MGEDEPAYPARVVVGKYLGRSALQPADPLAQLGGPASYLDRDGAHPRGYLTGQRREHAGEQLSTTRADVDEVEDRAARRAGR